MEDRLSVFETRLKELEKTKEDFYVVKNSITKMEMIDKNIFEKLEAINSNVNAHKESFKTHDKTEMEKYGAIDKRLRGIERVMYMALGAGLLIEFLSKMHLLVTSL